MLEVIRARHLELLLPLSSLSAVPHELSVTGKQLPLAKFSHLKSASLPQCYVSIYTVENEKSWRKPKNSTDTGKKNK